MFNNDWDSLILIWSGLCAVVGWAAIELILWLFSFVTISFG